MTDLTGFGSASKIGFGHLEVVFVLRMHFSSSVLPERNAQHINPELRKRKSA